MMRAVRPSLVLLLCLALGVPASWAAPRAHPVRPPADAAAESGPTAPPATLLMEVSTGQVLASSDAHRHLPPASLDKLMTLYLVLQAIRGHQITLDTSVTVSATTWRIGRTAGSSRMFLNVGDVVPVRDLLSGLMVASGNDAAEALAEAVGGSGEQFVTLMNAQAARLGMHDTHYVTPHGLPAPDEYTSAWDIALLARRVLLDFPDVVQITGARYEAYGGIRQANWNNLVFRDPRVDGLKTGHTSEAGFSIAATAQQGGMRLLAVVMGAPTLRRRTDLAEGLFAQGFGRYALVPVPWQRVVPASLRVYGGTTGEVSLETSGPVAVLVGRDTRPSLVIAEAITARPFAPVARAQQVGVLTVSVDGRALAATPLLAAQPVARAGLFGRLWGYIRYEVGVLFHRHRARAQGAYEPPQ
ncbi:MAG TPA: D-alanyl-D-alanine carboxypeptidase family protein [bacterium]|nr:D-alanyl-D-alanine carboxypeptidase family protein [bacterium]